MSRMKRAQSLAEEALQHLAPNHLSLAHTSYTPNTMTCQIRSYFRAFATSVPSTRKLFAQVFVWPAPFGPHNCHLQCKEFIPDHPEEAICQPLLNTFLSLRSVCVCVCSMSSFIYSSVSCLSAYRPSKAWQSTLSFSHWMEPATFPYLLDLVDVVQFFLTSRLPVQLHLQTQCCPFKFRTPKSCPLELSLIGHLPSPP